MSKIYKSKGSSFEHLKTILKSSKGIRGDFKITMILLLGLIYLPSCGGQPKINPPSVSQTLLTGQPKLIKTQGADAYQSVMCGLQDRAGNIWFGTSEEGVYRYDGKLFTQLTMKDGLSSNSVVSIMQDKVGNIWFGTTEGICRFDGESIVPIPIPFSIRPVINNNYYYSKWCTKSTVWSMLQDKTGRIWFGTGDGVYYYNGFSFARFLNNDGIVNQDSLHLKLVSDILEDKNGDIWFASGMPPGYEGLCHFDGQKIVSYKPNDEGWFRKIIESNNGNLLLATRHFGVWSYDGKSFSDYMQPKDLIRPSLNDILEDKAGNFWVASDYGVDMGDSLGGVWHSERSPFNPAEITFKKVFNKEVYFMLEDKDHNMWFGTRGVGLYRYDGLALTKFSE